MTDKPAKAQSVLIAAVLAGTGLSLVLMGLRISSVVSLETPIQLQTSGAEYESLYAIWRYIEGMAVYTDRYQPPYNLVIFNWLFYESYGLFTKTVTGMLGLGEAWIPTVARFFSAVAIALTAVSAFAAFRYVMPAKDRQSDLVAACFALLLTAGPLTGFWVFTVRPDIWAVALEVAGAAWFIRRYPANRWQALLGAALFAYLAWAFKQTNVSFLVAVGLFLLVRMAWRELFVIVAVMAAAFLVTFAVGEPQYLKNILVSGYPLEFEVSRGLRNLRSFAIKLLPGLAVLGAAVLFVMRSPESRREIMSSAPKLFAVAGAVVSVPLAVATGFQAGSAENYYFTAAFFVILCALALLPERPKWPAWVSYPLAAAWLALAVAVAMVLGGQVGMTSLEKEHVRYIRTEKCIAELPRPIFVNDPYLQLPWMTDRERHFVLSFGYHKERELGRPFARGGIGGMISRGEIATLVLPSGFDGDTFDGASLENFRRVETDCRKLTVLVRKSPG